MVEAYVGISGVGSVEQQVICEDAFRAIEFPAERKLLLGVKATTRIQVDETESRKGRNWFPVGEELRTTLAPSADSLKVLQLYADQWTDLVKRAIPLIENSLERSQEWVDGLQYDLLPWFTEDSSLQIIERYAHDVAVGGPVIVQCHGDIMQAATPEQLLERLKRIEGFITHILFDASEGRGLTMDPDTLSRWVEVVQNSYLDLGIAIAGGLGGSETAHLLTPVLRRFDDISWDAESRLHTNNVLNDEKVTDYLADSKKAIFEGEFPRKSAKNALYLGGFSIWYADVDRGTHYPKGTESDVEHSYMLSLIAMDLAEKYYPDLDQAKIAQFCLAHDMAEAITGDVRTFKISDEDRIAKEQAEVLATEQLIKELPKYWAQILADYSAQDTLEARFVRLVDKIMPILVNIVGDGARSFMEVYGMCTLEESRTHQIMRSAELKQQYPEFPEINSVRDEIVQILHATLFDQETGELIQK